MQNGRGGQYGAAGEDVLGLIITGRVSRCLIFVNIFCAVFVRFFYGLDLGYPGDWRLAGGWELSTIAGHPTLRNRTCTLRNPSARTISGRLSDARSNPLQIPLNSPSSSHLTQHYGIRHSISSFSVACGVVGIPPPQPSHPPPTLASPGTSAIPRHRRQTPNDGLPPCFPSAQVPPPRSSDVQDVQGIPRVCEYANPELWSAAPLGPIPRPRKPKRCRAAALNDECPNSELGIVHSGFFGHSNFGFRHFPRDHFSSAAPDRSLANSSRNAGGVTIWIHGNF